jgi:hypothetical protein
MTHPHLKPGSPVPAALAVHDPSEARAATNDDVAATAPAIRDPLGIVAIGMACLFGVMAAVISLG